MQHLSHVIRNRCSLVRMLLTALTALVVVAGCSDSSSSKKNDSGVDSALSNQDSGQDQGITDGMTTDGNPSDGGLTDGTVAVSSVTIEGVVRGAGAAGDLLKDVGITLYVDRDNNEQFAETEKLSAVTDATGKFALTGEVPTQGVRALLRASAQGRSTVFRKLALSPPISIQMNFTMATLETLTCTGARCALSVDSQEVAS